MNYLSIREVGARLGVSRWTVYRLRDAGHLRYTKGLGRNGRIRIPEEDVERYMTLHQASAKEPSA